MRSELVKPKDNKRSPKWAGVRRDFLKGKGCAVCGSTAKLEAHHKMPFHLDESKELDPANLIALCESEKYLNCHLFVGHLANFKSYNPDVEKDAKLWADKLKNRPK